MKIMIVAILALVACSNEPSKLATDRGFSGSHAFASSPAPAVAHTCTPVHGGDQCSDLLTQPIAAGTESATTVTLPAGASFVDGSIVLTGDAVGQFQIESATQTAGSDGVGLEVKFKNTGGGEVRFSADFSYALAP